MEKIAAAALYAAKTQTAMQPARRWLAVLLHGCAANHNKLAARRAAALSRARWYLHVTSEEAGLRARSDRRIRGHALGRVAAVLPELRNADDDWSIAEVSSSAALQLREHFSRLQLPKE